MPPEGCVHVLASHKSTLDDGGAIDRTPKKIGKSPLRGYRYLVFYTPYGCETCTKVYIKFFRSAIYNMTLSFIFKGGTEKI